MSAPSMGAAAISCSNLCGGELVTLVLEDRETVATFKMRLANKLDCFAEEVALVLPDGAMPSAAEQIVIVDGCLVAVPPESAGRVPPDSAARVVASTVTCGDGLLGDCLLGLLKCLCCP